MLGTTRRRRIRLSRMRPRRTSLVTRLEMGCRPLKCQMQGRCCVMLSSVVQLDGRSCSSRKGLFVDIVRMMVCCSSFMSAHSYRSFECMVMSKTDSLLHLTFATEHRSQLSFNRGALLCRSGILSRNLRSSVKTARFHRRRPSSKRRPFKRNKVSSLKTKGPENFPHRNRKPS